MVSINLQEKTKSFILLWA